jgi:hypothetical protein
MRPVYLVSAAFALLMSSAALGQAWREYSDRQEGWSINFPAEPRSESRLYTTASGAMVPSKAYTVDLPMGRYTLTFVELASRPEDEAQAIAHAVNAMRQKGRATYDDAHDLDGIPGHQISVVQPDGRLLLGSVYLYNHRLYITESSVPPGAAPPQQFQQSVAMIHPDGRVVDLEDEAEEAAERAKQGKGGDCK